ncbi:MAG: selenocysteine-specific translation elongation factor [Gemmatirosa sp.]
MIVGTAGHIDHGKTALVRALTGVDTDRLPEEKRRGITIDLGFAPLALGGVGTAGVVDVPGHEAFVRTMQAGATGIDVALVVVAADEGVMPQTREHLAILDLLGVRSAVVALTKADLVDDEWLALVTEDVRAALPAPLADAPIIPTSIVAPRGIVELQAALVDAVRALPGRRDDDLFRLPIDRAFSVRGTGTVVTGTVWSGALARDAQVRLLPSGRSVRVRLLQSHGREVDRVGPGARAAVALVGVEVGEVGRGTLLVTDDAWAAAGVWRADVALLGDAPQPLGPRTAVRLHLGTSEVGARVVAASGAVAPGERRPVRLVLDAPVAARAGDRFVLRGGSPLTTIGGGIVRDPLPPGRRVRPWPALDPAPAECLRLILDEAGPEGVPRDVLPIRLGTSAADVAALAARAEGVLWIGARAVAPAIVAGLAGRALAAVDAHHRAQPLDAGMSRQALRALLAAPPDVADTVLARLRHEGTVELDGARVRRTGWTPTPNPEQRMLQSVLEARLAAVGLELPTVAELTAEFGPEVPALIALAQRDGRLIAFDSERCATVAAVNRGLATLGAHLTPGVVYPPGALREILGISRKYLMSVLEYLDREGLTDRVAEGRRWRGAHNTSSAT